MPESYVIGIRVMTFPNDGDLFSNKQRIAQEGSYFSQRKGNGNPDTFDKKYWKGKECYKCGDKGHPKSYFKTKLDRNGNKKKKDDDSSSVSRN